MKVAQNSFEMTFVKFFPKNATLKLSLMVNDEPKKKNSSIFRFYISKLYVFLLKLGMALATTIRIKFDPV